eukprot:CAMPEP_0119546936 /NCGR_PEP_ID=MMETSP1352-20130426/1168_1 /TAXON_ID=265584 /ORGANISM="Stauroneis constricta, Strain CCMP1120" /LENGTH=206 /DNA_ID=CAMNT_0007591709 /DNA_START=99 /DNA_END=719 /DNA_ORIENTATION=+
MKLSKEQEEIVKKLGADVSNGHSTDEAAKRREQSGTFNVVRPPIDCPAWVCCLLPCIKGVPSMKAFATIKPEDAEVMRNGKWIRYDAASLVEGDIIRIEEGDIVPADCVLLEVDEGSELLVDIRAVTGDDRHRSALPSTLAAGMVVNLYMGGQVVQGSGIAVITSVGPSTLLGRLIKEKRFPPTENVLHEEEDEGIALVDRGQAIS